MEHRIRFQKTEEICELVNAASSCDFNVEIRSGERRVNAKSIIGVFSLDFSGDVVIIAYGKDLRLERFFTNHQAA